MIRQCTVSQMYILQRSSLGILKYFEEWIIDFPVAGKLEVIQEFITHIRWEENSIVKNWFVFIVLDVFIQKINAKVLQTFEFFIEDSIGSNINVWHFHAWKLGSTRISHFLLNYVNSFCFSVYKKLLRKSAVNWAVLLRFILPLKPQGLPKAVFLDGK